MEQRTKGNKTGSDRELEWPLLPVIRIIYPDVCKVPGLE